MTSKKMKLKKNEDYFTVRWDGLYTGKRNADEAYVIRDLTYREAVKEYNRLLKREDVRYAVIGYTDYDDETAPYDVPIKDCTKKAIRWRVYLHDWSTTPVAWSLDGAEHWEA